MPVVSLSMSNFYYRCLEQMARGRGISISKLLKQIVESHIDALINNRRLIISDYISAINNQNIDVGINNAALINTDYISAINNKNIDEVIKYPDTDKELAKRIEYLEKSVTELKDAVSALAKEFKDFVKKQQDLLNAYTSKSDIVFQRLSELIELFQQVAESLRAQGSVKVSEEAPRARVSEKLGKSQRQRRSLCDVLEEQLVVFESEIADKIRNRDAFFSAIEGRCGGIVIEGLKERIAVEKSFWQQFLEKLSKIDTSDDEKIKKSLDSLEFKLFKVLKESALIIFDVATKKWIFAEKQKTGTSSGTSSIQ
jgi:predicted DNA-binding ribbon-helix-helix protein